MLKASNIALKTQKQSRPLALALRSATDLQARKNLLRLGKKTVGSRARNPLALSGLSNS